MDGISFTYGVSAQRWLGSADAMELATNPTRSSTASELSEFLDLLEFKLATRELTGNAAMEAISTMLLQLSVEDAIVALKVLDRDLKINLGSTHAMKIWKDLVDKPNYMRCGVYNKKSKKDIKFPAYIQLKADGTYREAHVDIDGKVSYLSRSGKTYDYPVLTETLSKLPAGFYAGELTVVQDGVTLNRSEGNGAINSDTPPHDDIVFDMWDFITEDEYSNAKRKVKNKTPYKERFETLTEIIKSTDAKNIRRIPCFIVYSLQEAVDIVSDWMKSGFEGGVLKDFSGVFADGTSKYQLKMKICFDGDFRITGFQEGTPGTKREATFGAILFESEDGKIKGKTSGFTDKDLEMFNNNREFYIGKIITVEGNDLTKARNSDHYAISHPRYIEVRDDKLIADTLERVQESLEMAKEFSNV